MNDLIRSLTREDIIAGWRRYDSTESGLVAFIEAVPAARLAHDGAVAAMKAGDECGRAVWEGFLRCLYVCSSF